MAYTTLPLHLSLDECARILAIEPAHFNQSTADPAAHGFCSASCEDIWVEEPWQSQTGMSRASLARAIVRAEIEVGRYLDRPLTPTLRTRTFRVSPPSGPPTAFAGVRLPLGEHLVDYRPYTPTLLATARLCDDELQFLDEDEDGFTETVRLRLELLDPPAVDALVFHIAGQAGKPGAEIRPARRIEVEQVDDFFELTVDFDPWQLIQPGRFLLPSSRCAYTVTNLLDELVYVDAVDVSELRPDHTAPRVRFYYDPVVTCGRPDCAACTAETLEGEFASEGDNVLAYPAQWDAETATWLPLEAETCTCGRWPAMVQVQYYQSFCPPTPRSELCDEVKDAVALLAGARMQVNKCDCDCGAGTWFRTLQEDLASAGGSGRYTTQTRLDSFFGSLRGEQMVHDRLRALLGNSLTVRHGSY